MLIGGRDGLQRLSEMKNPLPVCEKILSKVNTQRRIEKMARGRKTAPVNKRERTRKMRAYPIQLRGTSELVP